MSPRPTSASPHGLYLANHLVALAGRWSVMLHELLPCLFCSFAGLPEAACILLEHWQHHTRSAVSCQAHEYVPHACKHVQDGHERSAFNMSKLQQHRRQKVAMQPTLFMIAMRRLRSSADLLPKGDCATNMFDDCHATTVKQY